MACAAVYRSDTLSGFVLSRRRLDMTDAIHIWFLNREDGKVIGRLVSMGE
jgi:hypothetical protein